MRKIQMVGFIAALGVGGTAFAAEGPSHSFVEGSYLHSDLQVPGENAGANGFIIGGSMELPKNFVVSLGYDSRGYDNDIGGLDTTKISVGGGYIWSLSDSVDVTTGASFESLKLEQGGSSKDSGLGLSLGVSSRVTEKLELTSNVKYTTIKFSDAGVKFSGFDVSAGARYYFSPSFAGGLDIVADKFYIGFSQATFVASLRYSFGNLFQASGN